MLRNLTGEGEGQVRDLQAQEYLYWHLTGTQVGLLRVGI
jgi:hypothetical protein